MLSFARTITIARGSIRGLAASRILRSASVVGIERKGFAFVPGASLLSAPLDNFIPRHIGPSTQETQEMLYELGLSHIDQLVEKAIPQTLLSQNFPTSSFAGETEVLSRLKKIVSENELFRSYIGCGYYNCVTPPVILRNMLENPGWYTPYTPYQPEISQGRLEALLNFQTMVCDLTGMKYANSSLLDEATAAGEAMQACMALSKVKERNFLVSQTCHPQTIDVLRTRAAALGINLIVTNAETFDLERTPVRGLIVQYPDTNGEVVDYSPLLRKAAECGTLSVVACDLLASTILTPPGELGADIAVGSAQRFGVPLGAGGPHAAFFSTSSDKVLRKMPGRIVGVSKDAEGNPAIRLALQSREQHIRREKATSNICTAQALLANVAGMYAVYHGPEGLKAIAERIHILTCVLAEGLKRMGYTVRNSLFFDTLTVKAARKSAHLIFNDAQTRGINLRILDSKHIGISLDETVSTKDLGELFDLFSYGEEYYFTPESLATEVHDLIDLSHLSRTSDYLTHPIFQQCRSEHEMLRYLHRLERKDLSLTTSMMPLGSCTMKLNATSEMLPLTWDRVSQIHPFVPLAQMAGYHQIFADLDRLLCEITGFAEISFQPNSGAQGEFAGLSVIREYHRNQGEEQRDVCLIPASAHGTNPASAVMAGMKVVVIKCDSNGYLDVVHLKEMAEKHANRLAALMVTYPSTYGVFEETIQGAIAIVHQHGGQVYLDGANMNAMVGLVRPAELGADVCHLNLHKTFCIPHGGGGPGMGPIGVADHLTPFLPNHFSTVTGGRNSIGPVAAAPFSSASILPITWMYLQMMGMEGLAHASKVAILNANYMRKRLEKEFHIRYTSNTGFTAHEFIIDVKPFKESAGIEVDDIAKRLMDYNFHAGTVSWPVPNSMMIEPTESESKEELDRFIDALLCIREEIREVEEGKQPREGNVLKTAPHTQFMVTAEQWDKPYSREKAAYPLSWVRENKHWPAVTRVQAAYGDRHLVCSCPSVEAYEDDDEPHRAVPPAGSLPERSDE